MFDNFFNWKARELVDFLLPVLFRKPKMLAFLKSIYAGIDSILDDLIAHREDALYQLNFSGDRLTFQRYINDEFDDDNRSITIVLGDYLPKVYVYKTIEERELYIYKKSENEDPTFIYKKQEYVGQIDFRVVVPLSLSFNAQELERLRVFVDKYKLLNKNFEIIEQ